MSAKAGSHSDKLKITQKVGQATPCAYQATLLQIETDVCPCRCRPAPCRAGAACRRALSPSWAAELPGVREYMAAYPYTCFEQNTSKAIALQDQEAWNKLAASLPATWTATAC
jgi:uncharacterized protein YfaS (alpha-2-macroglobulin family)